MKRAMPPLFLSVLLLAGACLAADHPIMQPDNETRLQWMREDLSLPQTEIDPNIRPKRGSFSLLGYLPYVPAERNQGNCGDCWTWAGTGCAEVNHGVKNGVADRLSIQYINSCGSNSSGQYCCCGGNLFRFSSWYSGQTIFIPWSNTNAAFADASSKCEYGASGVACGSISTNPNYHIAGISAATIPTYGETQYTAIQNIKNALNNYQAVYFGFFLPDNYTWQQFYDFWDNHDETWWFDFGYYSGRPWVAGEGGGHAVLITGYNDDAPTPYWQVVNSWGTASGMRPHGMFYAKMYANYDAFVDSPSPDNAMMLFQTLDVSFGGAPPSYPIRLSPDRTSFSAAYDEMYIYANTDAISTPCYPFVRVVTPYYGTYYLTSHYVMYPYPVPYTPYPITTTGISNLFLCGLWWRNLSPGTYYLEGGGVDASQPVVGGNYNYIGNVHRTAFTLN